MNELPITFWFEFASTYSYPAAMRIENKAAEYEVKIIWKPFLLGPIFRDQGWADSPFIIYPAKGCYMWLDLERICKIEDIEFQRPTEFPRHSLLAARVAASHAHEHWLPAFVKEIYKANFVRDEDIGLSEIVANCLRRIDQPPDGILRSAALQSAKSALRQNTDDAMALGVFGAPTFSVGKELFWGNDRLEQALACVCHRHS